MGMASEVHVAEMRLVDVADEPKLAHLVEENEYGVAAAGLLAKATAKLRATNPEWVGLTKKPPPEAEGKEAERVFAGHIATHEAEQWIWLAEPLTEEERGAVEAVLATYEACYPEG